MVMRVERIGQQYGIVLSDDAMQTLRLSEGAEVEVMAVAPDAPAIQYATEEQVLEAYRATLPQFSAAYQELAK